MAVTTKTHPLSPHRHPLQPRKTQTAGKLSSRGGNLTGPAARAGPGRRSRRPRRHGHFPPVTPAWEKCPSSMLTLPLLERHASRVTQFSPSPLHATRGWQLVNMGGHNCWGEQGRDRGPAFPFLRARKSSTVGTAQAGRARTAHPMHPPHPQSPSRSPGVLLMPPKNQQDAPGSATALPRLPPCKSPANSLPMAHYRDGSGRHAAGVTRQHAAQQQHPDPLGSGHQRVSRGGGQRREHDAQFAAQAVVEEHGADPPRRRSQREHRLWGDTERDLGGSELPPRTPTGSVPPTLAGITPSLTPNQDAVCWSSLSAGLG